MISKFKDSLYGLLVKILLGLVAFSLVFWGLGTKNSSREDFAASIDNKHFIYTDKLNLQTKNLTRSIATMNPGISLENIDVESVVLNSLIRNKILELELQQLGISVSDEMAKNEIRKNKFFFNANGHFDHDLFKRIIINQGMTEKEYVTQQKLVVATQIINSAIIPFSAPESMAKSLYQYQNQDRTLSLIYIKPKIDNNSFTPSDEDIKGYYESHTQDFTLPETRDVEYVVLSPKYFDNLPSEKNKITVSNPDKLMHSAIKEIEDDISAGDSLEKIAKKYKIPHYKIDKLSSSTSRINNIKPDDTQKFIALVFENEEENSPSDTKQLSIESNDYYIINTKIIYPAKTVALDKVKAEIIKILNSHDSKSTIKKSANSIYRNFVINSNISDLIKNNKGSVTQDTITISRTSSKINQDLLSAGFDLTTVGSYTNLIQDNDTTFVFAVLEKVTVPTATNIPQKEKSELTKAISDTVDTATHTELMRYFYGKHNIELKKSKTMTTQN
jgi:hypothetical protein